MRRLVRYSAIALAGVLAASCSNTPSQPSAAQLSAGDLAQLASKDGNGDGTGKPELDPTWANGQTVYMVGPHLIVGARENQPNLYAHAEELYLLAYPWPPNSPPPQPGAGPITLPSGYLFQCNPCFHPGLPPTLVYHDHVIPGAPGGNNTADGFKGPWKIIVLVYTPQYVGSTSFKPVTSADDVDIAEANGRFLPINQGGANPYEFEPGNVLICPIIQTGKTK